jgi:hypothetical protein
MEATYRRSPLAEREWSSQAGSQGPNEAAGQFVGVRAGDRA